jgi:hypothetical protein
VCSDELAKYAIKSVNIVEKEMNEDKELKLPVDVGKHG